MHYRAVEFCYVAPSSSSSRPSEAPSDRLLFPEKTAVKLWLDQQLKVKDVQLNKTRTVGSFLDQQPKVKDMRLNAMAKHVLVRLH